VTHFAVETFLGAKLAKKREKRKEIQCSKACGKLVELRAAHANFSKTDRLVG